MHFYVQCYFYKSGFTFITTKCPIFTQEQVPIISLLGPSCSLFIVHLYFKKTSSDRSLSDIRVERTRPLGLWLNALSASAVDTGVAKNAEQLVIYGVIGLSLREHQWIWGTTTFSIFTLGQLCSRRGSRKKHLGGLALLNFPSPPFFPTLFPSLPPSP